VAAVNGARGRARGELGEDAARSLTGGSGIARSGSGGNGSGQVGGSSPIRKRELYFLKCISNQCRCR
jgi:hypothetical protein